MGWVKKKQQQKKKNACFGGGGLRGEAAGDSLLFVGATTHAPLPIAPMPPAASKEVAPAAALSSLSVPVDRRPNRQAHSQIKAVPLNTQIET
jgi:hypothetical protein